MRKIFATGTVGPSMTKWGAELQLRARDELYSTKCGHTRVKFAVDLLRYCGFGDIDQWQNFEGRQLAAANMKANLNTLRTFITRPESLLLIRGGFGKNPDDLQKREFAELLKFINSIIESCLGIKLVSANKKGKAKVIQDYKIEASSDFMWADDRGYLAKIDWGQNNIGENIFGDYELVEEANGEDIDAIQVYLDDL